MQQCLILPNIFNLHLTPVKLGAKCVVIRKHDVTNCVT